MTRDDDDARRAALRRLLARPIAHRGLHHTGSVLNGAPENGLQAVEAAAAEGYGVEIDVRLSGDDAPMVFHDASLDRMCRVEGAIEAMAAAELARCTLKGGFASIPTLQDALAAAGDAAPMLVEIKAPALRARWPVFVARVATLVAAGAERRAAPVALMSFEPAIVAHCAQTAPSLLRGLVTTGADIAERRPRPSAWSEADFVSVDHSALRRVAKLVRVDGKGLVAWTIRTSAEAERALDHGAQLTFEGFRP